ncbi:transposase [Microcoleus sp. MON1_C5]|uniref:transposase n=1 Tax=Microcoleus sp. MON1_C5 TaxID=2818828 RepID=UPI002FD00113
MWSEPGYTYYFRGEQKRLEQTQRRGRRLSIIGFLQHEISFVYGLVIGGVNRKSYIHMMEQEALDAKKTGRTRVIVQDNGPIHRCHEVQVSGTVRSLFRLAALRLPFLRVSPIQIRSHSLEHCRHRKAAASPVRSPVPNLNAT